MTQKNIDRLRESHQWITITFIPGGGGAAPSGTVPTSVRLFMLIDNPLLMLPTS